MVDLRAKIHFFFSVGGIVSGVFSAFASMVSSALAPLILFLLFFLWYKISPKVVGFDPSHVEGGWSTSLVFKRYFWIFFIMWLVFWVLAYTDIVRLL